MKPFLALSAALAAGASAAAQEAPAPATHYIPPGAASAFDSRWDEGFHEGWFGKHLASMHEPRLWPEAALNGYRARYRLLALPSFTHPYAIRIDVRTNGTATATFTRTKGLGGYNAGPIATQRTVRIGPAALAAIRRALVAARFDARGLDAGYGHDQFGAPEPPSETMTICTDGTEHVFEARTAAGDHMVVRDDCELDSTLRDLIHAFATASPIKP